MSDTYLVGCGAGFSGDRTDAAMPVVKAIVASGRPGALLFETLAERTLALGQRAKLDNPELGYEPLLSEFLPPILTGCVTHGIPIIGNFGGAHPQAAAWLIQKMARDAGLPPLRIAVVDGDDIKDVVDVSDLEVWEGDRSLVGNETDIVAANVYLGAKPIADALLAGAQIVVTGRVADPALALGPLVAHFGWAWTDLGSIAAGTLAGHLLECGAQVTGGYFADPGYKDVASPATIGFPIAEVSANGDIVITKPAGTGGVVDLRTVKEQILYELHDPHAYLTPDVTLDISDVVVEQVGPDRVLVRGARGHGAPPSLKATVTYPGDWFGEAEISYGGPNALARARLAAETVRERIALRRIPVRVRFDLIGTQSIFDSDAGYLGSEGVAEPGEVRMRLAVSGTESKPVERSLQEVLALYTCGPAGGGGVRSRMQNRVKTVSCLVPRNAVSPRFTFLEA